MEVELIKAHDSFDGSARRKIERLRVAAYCRVSTDDEDQIKSYNSMVTHYTELIKNNKEWIFSGIYADKAITGTKIDKRDEFQRLIQDFVWMVRLIWLLQKVSRVSQETP